MSENLEENGNHLKAAGFTELQFPFLESVEDSVSLQIDGSFGNFYLGTHRHFLNRLVWPWFGINKIEDYTEVQAS